MRPINNRGDPGYDQIQCAQANTRIDFRFRRGDGWIRQGENTAFQPGEQVLLSSATPNQRLPKVIMHIDEPWHDNLAGRIDDLPAAFREVCANCGDLIADQEQVRLLDDA